MGLDDSDGYRIDVHSGAAEKLTAHEGKELVSISDISPDGGHLLLSSEPQGGLPKRSLARSRVEATEMGHRYAMGGRAPGEFSPDGKSFTYELNADGRASVQFVDSATLKAK